MTTFLTISLLSFLAGSLPLAALLYLHMKMHQEREEQWTRIFSVHSLAIPKASMDADAEKAPKDAKPDTRKRLSFALPVPQYAKDVYRSMKAKGN